MYGHRMEALQRVADFSAPKVPIYFHKSIFRQNEQLLWLKDQMGLNFKYSLATHHTACYKYTSLGGIESGIYTVMGMYKAFVLVLYLNIRRTWKGSVDISVA